MRCGDSLLGLKWVHVSPWLKSILWNVWAFIRSLYDRDSPSWIRNCFKCLINSASISEANEIFKYTNAPISPTDPRATQFAEAASLLRSMGNFTLDPCEDFYQFTCSAMPISQESSFSTASTRNIIKMAEKINDPTYRNSNVSIWPSALQSPSMLCANMNSYTTISLG